MINPHKKNSMSSAGFNINSHFNNIPGHPGMINQSARLNKNGMGRFQENVLGTQPGPLIGNLRNNGGFINPIPYNNFINNQGPFPIPFQSGGMSNQQHNNFNQMNQMNGLNPMMNQNNLFNELNPMSMSQSMRKSNSLLDDLDLLGNQNSKGNSLSGQGDKSIERIDLTTSDRETLFKRERISRIISQVNAPKPPPSNTYKKEKDIIEKLKSLRNQAFGSKDNALLKKN